MTCASLTFWHSYLNGWATLCCKQFGCGKSKMKGKGTRDPEASDYTLDSFVAQLGSVRSDHDEAVKPC